MESCGSIIKRRSLLISSNPDRGLEPLSWGVPSPRVWNWEWVIPGGDGQKVTPCMQQSLLTTHFSSVGSAEVPDTWPGTLLQPKRYTFSMPGRTHLVLHKISHVRQVLGPGALGRPRGIGWRGRWEGGSGWGIHVYPWLIHVNVWQNPLQYCEVISLQLIKKKIKLKKISHVIFFQKLSSEIFCCCCFWFFYSLFFYFLFYFILFFF